MRNYFKVLAIFAMLLICSVSYASVGVRLNGAAVGTATDLNFVCGSGTSSIVTQDGSMYNINCSPNLAATGIANGGATSMVTTDSAVPTTYALVRKAIASLASGGTQTGTLANGIPGQLLSFQITSVGASGTFTITPTTSTGWSTLKFTAQNDQVVLLYVSDTIGWILEGVDGSVTIGHTGNN